jgi:hypothetical protein
MMRWWWFGPAVNTAQLEREMRLMKEAASVASRYSRFIRSYSTTKNAWY